MGLGQVREREPLERVKNVGFLPSFFVLFFEALFLPFLSLSLMRRRDFFRVVV